MWRWNRKPKRYGVKRFMNILMMIGNRWCVLESNELFSDKDSGIARAFHTNFGPFILLKAKKSWVM